MNFPGIIVCHCELPGQSLNISNSCNRGRRSRVGSVSGRMSVHCLCPFCEFPSFATNDKGSIGWMVHLSADLLSLALPASASSHSYQTSFNESAPFYCNLYILHPFLWNFTIKKKRIKTFKVKFSFLQLNELI